MKALLATGLVVRLALVALTEGFGYDQQGFHAAESAFRELGLHAYAGTDNLWPYPPAYFPWLLAAAEIGAFGHTLRLPAVAADLVIAWLVASLLERRGAPRATQLAAVAVVMSGPVFVAHSGHHGQLDSVATAFGLAAVWVWTRPGQARRALLAGLLIGAGATVKTVPVLLVLALSPSARGWRERAVLAGTAGAVFLAAVAPFALAEPEGARAALTYKGVPGFGGLSLLVLTLSDRGIVPTEVFLFLSEHSQAVLLGPALLLAAVALHRRAVEPVAAATVVWLTVYALGFNFFVHYLIWGVPFLLALGYVVPAAVVVWAMLAPLSFVYLDGEAGWVNTLAYTVPLLALWAAICVVLTRAARPAPARSGTAT